MLKTFSAICLFVLTFTALPLRAADAPAPPPPSLVVPATIEAFEQTDLYAKTAGYLTAVNVDIGDHVKAGQVLAVIDVPEMEDDLTEAKATLAAKRSLFDAATAATRQSRMALEVARHQLDRYKVEADFEDITLKRQQELFTGKAITDQQLDDARSKAAIARSDVGVAEAKVAAADADVVGADANRDVAAAQAKVAEAAVARMQTLLRYARITAPYDGMVTRRLVNHGDLVQAATATRAGPLFTVQRVETVRIFCEVPEANAASISIGTPAVIKVYGAGSNEVIAAKVTRLAGALTPETRTRRVEIDLANPDETLLPGTYAQVTLAPLPATAAK